MVWPFQKQFTIIICFTFLKVNTFKHNVALTPFIPVFVFLTYHRCLIISAFRKVDKLC